MYGLSAVILGAALFVVVTGNFWTAFILGFMAGTVFFGARYQATNWSSSQELAWLLAGLSLIADTVFIFYMNSRTALIAAVLFIIAVVASVRAGYFQPRAGWQYGLVLIVAVIIGLPLLFAYMVPDGALILGLIARDLFSRTGL